MDGELLCAAGGSVRWAVYWGVIGSGRSLGGAKRVKERNAFALRCEDRMSVPILWMRGKRPGGLLQASSFPLEHSTATR